MDNTITITFCDRAENHVGMEKIGQYATSGYDLNDLIHVRDWFKKKGIKSTVCDLNYPIENKEIYPDEEAYILIVPNGINYLLENNTSNDLMAELTDLPWDEKAMMYGRVVNKKARHNLCFAENKRKPNYQQGKGRIVAFADVPILSEVRDSLMNILEDNNLVAEGNHYYHSSCGIGYHGDSERRKVIGVRLGRTTPLVYQWYHQGKSVGEKMIFELNDGDIYIMSEKATGNDWKKKSLYTLRHAAGDNNYTKIN